MAVELKKIYKERMPSLRLIGKRYFDQDRQNGSFGHKWGEWFQKGWFGELEKLNPIAENDNAYLGVMGFVDGMFVYWIGMFFPENTDVPEGFEYEDIGAFDVATCWLYGNEKNGELYGSEVYDMVVDEARKNGMVRKENGWCFERYNCPRFTSPDEKGNVILDYCISVL